MQISDGDVERELGTETKTEDKGPDVTNSESVSLYQDPYREFFGKTVTAIAECCNIKRVKIKPNTKLKQEALIKCLCSQETYSQMDYYSGLTQNLNGIQKDVRKHVSRQDWIDVVEEYKSKVENMYEASHVQVKQMQNYYETFQFVKEIRAEVDAVLTEESSIPHQCELLCKLGMKKYIHACRGAMVDWFCYVCMRDYVDYQIYSDHVRGKGHRKGHDENIIKAGTTIGNMFLIKYLQRNLIAAQHKEQDSSTHSDHMDGGIKCVQDLSPDVRKVLKAKELAELVDKDWSRSNLERLRDFMPQIPSVYMQLNFDDIREIRKEYLAAIKEAKTTLESGNKDKEYRRGIKKYKDTKHEYKCETLKGWIRSQQKLFAELNLSEEIKVVSMSDENKFTCFLCHSSHPNTSQYNDHVATKLHTSNMAGVCTTLGKMFFVKYLQKVAADVPEPHFCDMCMQKYTCSRKKHCRTQSHRNAYAPYCAVCGFNSRKFQRSASPYVKAASQNMVQQKIESGELPPDYKDPILEVNADPETEDSSHTKPPEGPVEIGGTDVEQEQQGGGTEDKDLGPTNSESLSLFQNTDREFFGKTVIASRISEKRIAKQNPSMDQVIRDLCSEKTYRQEDYYSGLSGHLWGIQKDIWKHVSRQDWMDVVEEYVSKMNNVYEASVRQFKQTQAYYKKQKSVIELKAEVDAELTEESSIPHQWELLCQLGMKKYIHANRSRSAMVDWFCYVCMTDYNSYQPYKDHLSSIHHRKVMQAGTTIGNMFLIKFLQRYLVKMPESHQFCSFRDVTHTDPSLHTIVNGKGPHGILEERRRSGDVKCEVCNLSFLTQEERKQHCQNVWHNMVKVCKIQHGFLPADYKEEVDQETAEEYDAEKQEETLEPEECSRMEEELKDIAIKNQQTKIETKREDDVNSLKRVNSTDHSKSPKRIKAGQTITSIRHDIPKKDRDAGHGHIVKTVMIIKEDKLKASAQYDKSAKDGASKQQTQQEKACKEDAGPTCGKDTGSTKQEPVPKDGTGRKHGASIQQEKSM
ncbi:uncharacterized protein [Amphiura filiformis]|uniref:uncharacterized protein n=1 Tax=Amphiura filiformis TaxID=82378 RepID=UPI003B224D91